ncbi:MAG TPA: glycoside hydrolase family 2 TIM barrel-domain containing protein [Mycobacteriales bacterium]|nr:glycoside hydrolase family 2 TIM barrel-domain containing protein [Mycobacteriales bacterium]
MPPIPRRRVLAGGAAIAAGLAVPIGLPRGAAAAVPPDAHGDHEPSGTDVVSVGDTNVVIAYGAVVPSFDGWSRPERTREYLSLDRPWRFRFDPDGAGEAAGWQQPETDDRGWDRIAVPSAWDLQDTPGFGGYDGSDFGTGTAFVDGYAWYRIRVAIPRGWAGRHVRLNFLAVSYSADVWLNGRLLGRHEGGSTAFALPAGAALRPGADNVLAVRVYRSPSYTDYGGHGTAVVDDKALPPGPCDYWPYAGILRSSWLEATPPVTVAKLLVSAANGRADVRAVIENHSDRAVEALATLDLRPYAGPVGQRITVPAGGIAVARAEVDIPNAPQWTPGRPKVLTARAGITAGVDQDTLSTTYGVRALSISDAKLRLNGDQLFLKGTNWHEESPQSGRAMTIAELDAELTAIASSGVNFIRNCVYNRHPYVYDWADRHGMLVLDEFDTMWVHPSQMSIQLDSYGLSRALALTTAWNQHNHPSVIIWGLQNESERDPDGAPIYRAWIGQMKDAITSVDLAARPVTWASATALDPAFDLADVVGFNEYFGYFTGKVTDLGPTLDQVHANHPDKPILITENGSWSLPGNHGPRDQAGTEEWQAGLFEDQWAQLGERSDFVLGYTFWVFKDYKERENYNQTYNGISEMGMLTFDRSHRRLVFDSVKKAQKPDVTG